jgi:hypothetical protein
MISTLLLAITLTQAQTALTHAMASVNGKVAYNNKLEVRVAQDRAVGNRTAVAADLAKKRANWLQLQTAWKQWAVAYATYTKLKPKQVTK